MAEPEKPRKHDVMISYNWDNKETVLKIREKLRENGISCWIDVENMSGSTLEAMSAAVENCTIFLMCYSGKYSESNNCQAGKVDKGGGLNPPKHLRLLSLSLSLTLFSICDISMHLFSNNVINKLFWGIFRSGICQTER